ncbi:hypothetical protein [Flexivirga alba]|uniref:Uncharacterized protein n=1 Tax=Flexivirga alba TaxID=702742 RepID=A0ABW2AMH4_9MICO
MRSTNTSGWLPDIGLFILWSAAGLASAVEISGLLTIGILVAPVAWALLGLSAWRTFRRPGRTHTMAGLLLLPALVIGYLGSWTTFMSDAEGDHCASSGGVTMCQSSATCDPSGQCTDATPPVAGDGSTHFHWLSALPFITVGIVVVSAAVAILIVGHRRTNRRLPRPA